MGRGRDFTQDPTIQGQLRSLDKTLAAQKVADRRRVMLTPEGRRVMYDLIFGAEFCGVMGSYPAADNGIFINEGKREVGCKLARTLQEEVPDQYVQMINEQVEDAANYRKMREAALQPTVSTGDDR